MLVLYVMLLLLRAAPYEKGTPVGKPMLLGAPLTSGPVVLVGEIMDELLAEAKTDEPVSKT